MDHLTEDTRALLRAAREIHAEHHGSLAFAPGTHLPLEAAGERIGINPDHLRYYDAIKRNTIVFLAADARRLKDLDGRVRQLLAWSSIEEDADTLNLTRLDSRQAATRRKEAESAVAAQIGEAWSWCLVPEQPDPMGEVEWAEICAGGSSQDVPAVRASRKLVSEELFLTNLGAVRLKMELDRALWRNADHINTRQLWECLCSYLYLLGSTEEFAELYRKNFPRVISVFEASIH